MSVASADVVAAPAKRSPSAFLPWLADNGVFVFTAVLIVFAGLFVDGFASLDNMTTVLNRVTPIGIVAVGMTFVVISANYLDLSVVAQVATSGVIFIGVSNRTSIFVAILLAIVVALIYGLVNGIAVGVFKANAVIVTLSTTFIGLGVLRWLSGGSVYFSERPIIETIGTAKILSVPVAMILLFLIALLMSFVLNRTTFGFTIKSFGSNPDATRLAGVRTSRVVIGAFTVSALGAMVAGFVLAARSQTAVSAMSDGYDFQALAAIIVGGTSVFGGKGSVLRTLLGVIFISVLTNIMVLSNWGFGLQQMAIGALIVAAVSVDALARRASTS